MKTDPVLRCLTLLDPITKRVLCSIRNPKVKISGFKNNGENCIDLQQFMRENNHNFWFDPDERLIEDDKRVL